MTAWPGWSTSPRSRQMRTRPHKEMFSHTSRLRTDAFGCSRKASSASREICRSRIRKWYGRLTSRRLPTCSLKKVDRVAWRLKPSSYIVATKDRTVQHELERFLAKRMEATTYEVASSHVPMPSNPKLVIDVILKATYVVSEERSSAA